MRTFLLIAGTFALLVGIFIGYTMTQTGSTPVQPGYGGGGPVMLPDQRESIIGRGEQAWVKVFNDNWEVASQFRAAEYDPRRDGRVHVAQPESIFFLSGGELIRVRGQEGVVVMSRLPEPESGGTMAPSEPPSRGELIDVEIELFDSPEALEADSPDNDTSTLRVRLNNAAFDNETSRIYTESAIIDGQMVPADQIPVTVRGRDYDFDGRGLTIRWNDRDRRLELLRIEHGERLIIKDPQRFTEDAFGPSQPAGDAAARTLTTPWMLAATDTAAIAQALPAPATRPAKPAYRAHFDRNVRVFQGNQPLVHADRMFIDFVFDSRHLESGPGPTPKDPTSDDPPAQDQPAAAVPAGAILAAERQPSTQPAPSDSSPATTGPVADTLDGAPPVEPVIVHWDGPLIVTPSPENSPRPAMGTGIIHLVGQPLRLQRDRGEITAASFIYDTGARTLAIDAADEVPVVLRDGDGTIIQTRSLTYAGNRRRAELRGASDATFPVRGDADAPPQSLQATWTDRCILHLGEDGFESLAIERAQLAGTVRINHPAVRLASQALDLDFQPPSTTQPAENRPDVQLRSLAARGEVDCTLVGDDQTEQRIQADRLEIATAIDDRGRTYPQQVKADGRLVRATDGQQSLAARHMTATLRPVEGNEEATSASQIALDRLVAIDSAEYTRADGQRAAADRIEVVMTGDQPTITLLGDATLSDGANTVHGPHVQILADQQVARIVGPGTLEAMLQTEPGADPRPLSVEWGKNAIVDGKANRVDVAGDVTVTTSTPDGAAHALTSSTMTMTLADVPQEPSPTPPVEAVAADQPELLEHKRVESVTFEQKVELRSLRNDETGRLLRRFVLVSERLVYQPQQRRMVVPVPGRLLFEDHPQPARAAGDDENQLFGATAMKWEKQLTYDENEQHITLEGDVLIVHEPDENQKQPPFRLSARTVTAELDRTRAAAADDGQRPDLRRLIAEQSVRFTSRDIELEAARIEHDPQTGWVIATGTKDVPVEIHQGVTRGSFREARFNLRTEQLKVTDFRGNVR